jgi:hypothetical protein
MALPRRAPREVYKLFSESDFIAGAETGEVFAPDTTRGDSGRRVRRIAGPATLVGVLAAVVAMLLTHPPLAPAPRPLIPRAGVGGDARIGQPGSQRVTLPAPAPVRERGPSFSARRRTVAAEKPLATSAAMSRQAGEGAPGRSQDALSPSENAEFGFER